MASVIRRLDGKRVALLRNIVAAGRRPQEHGRLNYSGFSRMVNATTEVSVVFNHQQLHDSATVNKAAMAKAATTTSELTSQSVFDREDKYGAHNYHPLPVALSRGEGKCVAKVVFRF